MAEEALVVGKLGFISGTKTQIGTERTELCADGSGDGLFVLSAADRCRVHAGERGSAGSFFGDEVAIYLRDRAKPICHVIVRVEMERDHVCRSESAVGVAGGDAVVGGGTEVKGAETFVGGKPEADFVGSLKNIGIANPELVPETSGHVELLFPVLEKCPFKPGSVVIPPAFVIQGVVVKIDVAAFVNDELKLRREGEAELDRIHLGVATNCVGVEAMVYVPRADVGGDERILVKVGCRDRPDKLLLGSRFGRRISEQSESALRGGAGSSDSSEANGDGCREAFDSVFHLCLFGL